MKSNIAAKQEIKEDPLNARALKLAKPVQSSAGNETLLEVLEVMVAGERYAIESTRIHAAVAATRVTRTPRGGEALLGIISVHSRLVPLFDLRNFLNHPARTARLKKQPAILFENEKSLIGLAVDGIDSIALLSTNQLHPVSPKEQPYIHGMTASGLALLNLPVILNQLNLQQSQQ